VSEQAVFVVARNPEEDTRLPFLLRIPVENGVVLKARETWPTVSRVYCHPFDGAWPEDAEVIEEVPVLSCRRRGGAVDLVLDRPRLRRSQFVFTEVRGREAIFWQTQKTARGANPGGRIPRRRTLRGAVRIAVDTRERYPYRFAAQGAETVRVALPAGDYAVPAGDETLLAGVERKSLENLAATLSDGTLALPDAAALRAPPGRGGGGGEVLRPVQAGARLGGLAGRPALPPRGALPGSPGGVRRFPALRRGLDLPVPVISGRGQ
jgi:hypothetical protein